jgi:hypothetical protein
LEIIKNLKQGKFIEGIVPPNIDKQAINDIKILGFAAESNIKQLKRYQRPMIECYNFLHLVLSN